MKGWYTPARPDELEGESTGWYASFRAFCADYLSDRFGDDWCLSPEQSLSLHIGDWTVPKQLLVRTPKGGNKPTQLLFGTSVFDVRLELPLADDIEVKNGLRVISLPAALIGCAPSYFAEHPDDLRARLRLHPPLHGWKWAHGTFSDECHDGGRRLSLDDRSRRAAR
jgi:hypothetical protein